MLLGARTSTCASGAALSPNPEPKPKHKPTPTPSPTPTPKPTQVRMLGDGRPFVLELLRPKRPYRTSASEMADLEAEINASQQLVRVRGLGPCASEVIGGLVKQGEDSHRKDYRCVVRVGRRLTPADLAMLNGRKDVLLQQKTPLRVLHRRTQMVRPRMIHEMHAVMLAPRVLQLDLCTQAATYSNP